MNTQALIAYYRGLGWKIDEGSLRLVSNVDGTQKYDINVVSPDNQFGVTQIVVRDGNATALGSWVERDEDFATSLNTFLRSMEAGDVFAIVVNQIFESDKSALVTAYTGTTTVTAQVYIVRERASSFSFKPVVTV